MKTSDAMRAKIEAWEGCELRAYQDVVGVWTIGYGHTGADVYEGQIITQVDADNFLSQDLHRFEAGVADEVMDNPTTQGQFDALVSLAYNVGLGNEKGSTVLREHCAGNYQAAADAFELWDKAGGRVLEALAARRRGEAQWYIDASPVQ